MICVATSVVVQMLLFNSTRAYIHDSYLSYMSNMKQFYTSVKTVILQLLDLGFEFLIL